MIYLDNAATTYPKPRKVISEVNRCLKKYCGNPGRSSHDLSYKAAEKIYSVREKIAEHLNIESPESVVFTYNATYALNLAIKSFVEENCHVLTTDFEHNSVIRPLEKLAKKNNIEYSSFSSNGDIEANIINQLRPNTKGLVCSLASNVIGIKIDLEVLSRVAKKHGLFLIIDASQAIGHYKIDLKNNPCDVLCAPGHKALFGIQGSGFAVFKNKYRGESFVEGGSGSDSEKLEMPINLPEGYEAGTLATPSIVSVGAGIDYINEIGIDEITKKLEWLCEYAKDGLSSFREIEIYKCGSGLLSFNYKNIDSSKIAMLLNDEEICVRGGLHCSPTAHRIIGTLHRGAVRVSFSHLNDRSDFDRLYRSMKRIVSIY